MHQWSISLHGVCINRVRTLLCLLILYPYNINLSFIYIIIHVLKITTQTLQQKQPFVNVSFMLVMLLNKTNLNRCWDSYFERICLPKIKLVELWFSQMSVRCFILRRRRPKEAGVTYNTIIIVSTNNE